jgi:hypothetical protein
MLSPLGVIVKGYAGGDGYESAAATGPCRSPALHPSARSRPGPPAISVSSACRARSELVLRSGRSGRPTGRLDRPTRQVRREIRSDSARPDGPGRDRVGPRDPADGEPDKRDRIGFHDVGRCPTSVAWAGYALNRSVRRNAHLNRSARGAAPQRRQQQTDRVPKVSGLRFPPCVDRLKCGGHCVRIGTTRGHDRTIRFV